jgi:outer membrane biosynthesis protein TonB
MYNKILKAMKAPIDKLFREKLAEHSLNAPPMAWGKIESNLPKKNNSFFWLKIAASFVLLIAAAILLWPREQDTTLLAVHNKPTEKAISNKQNEKEKSEKEKTEKETQQTEKVKSNAVKKNEETENKKSVKPNSKTVPQKTSVPVMNFSKQESFIASNDTPETKKELNAVKDNNTIIKVDQDPIIIATEPVVATANNQQSNTIVLAANDVSKYLKNTSMADATNEEENTSSFRKLLDKAADLKNSDSGLSELRQKKNEILALNFRNDKRERNN